MLRASEPAYRRWSVPDGNSGGARPSIRLVRLPVKTINRRSYQAVPALALASVLVLTLPGAAMASVSSVPDDTGHLAGSGFALAQNGSLTYVGGTFTKLGGKPRANIGALRADGTVDPTFLPSTDGKVKTIAVSDDGTRVFLGGTFTTVDGQPRANLAAVDATTGALVSDWQADTTGTTPDVHSLAVHGDMLYVAGKYGGIGGTARKRLQAVSVSTGAVIMSFNAKVSGGIRQIELQRAGRTPRTADRVATGGRGVAGTGGAACARGGELGRR